MSAVRRLLGTLTLGLLAVACGDGGERREVQGARPAPPAEDRSGNTGFATPDTGTHPGETSRAAGDTVRGAPDGAAARRDAATPPETTRAVRPAPRRRSPPAPATPPADTITRAAPGDARRDTASRDTARRDTVAADTTPGTGVVDSAPRAAAAAPPVGDPYHRPPRDTVSPAEYDGWKQYNLNCARCHGEDVLGTTIAPHLLQSLKPGGSIPTKAAFIQVVCQGRPERGMPAWCPLGMEPTTIERIYAYVKGRSEGRIGPGRPARQGG
ncbi:MAG TPA: cytochrome c [Gemmatimonadales bacterium]|nr:cytochrome c [Gemmatimonadales bacterium]